MNPAKLQLDHDLHHQQHSIKKDQTMTGNRPSPLKINKGSYLIHKPASSGPRATAGVNKMQDHQEQQQQRQPVIIYTQSPKVIHTQARDFMALVQKLTGLSRSDNHENVDDQQHCHNNVTTAADDAIDHVNTKDSSNQNEKSDVVNNNSKSISYSVMNDDNDQSSSGLTDECGGNVYENENKSNHNVHNHHQGRSASGFLEGYSPNTMSMFSHPSPFYADIPLFTPTSTSSSTDFFCSPRPLYRFPDSSSHASQNVGGSISPSMFKFIKGLPEY